MKARLAVGLADNFVKCMPSAWDCVRNALVEIRQRIGNEGLRERGVVILCDTCFSGTLPLALGADLPPGYEGVTVRSMGIGLVPRFWASPERTPWGSGLPYDKSAEGIKRNLEAYAETYNVVAEDRARFLLEALNCERSLDSLFELFEFEGLKHPVWDASTLCHGVTLQMGIPELEFPAEVIPSHLKFAGSLPLKSLPANLEYPDWFSEVLDNSAISSLTSDRKRVVFVAQGTETLDYRELVIPTLHGLSGRDDILVIAILCVKGARLDPSHLDNGIIPSNARVTDYFPYDAVLPHVDVFLSNSGYGGLTHAIANAVPVVQAGNKLDKPDIGRRVEYSGLGLFLSENHPPRPAEVLKAVEEVSRDGKFKDRALQLQAESQVYKPLDTVVTEILGLVNMSS